MDDPNLTTAVSSAGFLPTTSANYLVMPFTPAVPSVPMPQPVVWTPMQQTPLVVPVTPHVVSAPPRFNPRASRKNFRQQTPTEPPITVFVGNISEKAHDAMIRHILAICGNIASWKRVQGFGFCEYYGAEAALRAIKVLHDMEVGGKKLVVKVDSKAQEILDQFKAEKKGADETEESQQFEIYCRQRINNIIAEHNDEMTKEGKKKTEEEEKPSIVDNVGFDLVPNEDEKKNLIFREIGKFREVMKKREEEKEVERKKKQEKLNGMPDSLDFEEIRRIRRREEREKREKEKEERDKREREREREERDKREREKKERRDKEREREKKDREKSIDKENRKEKEPEKSRGHYDKSRLREKEMEEEELELKKEDDKRRERELAYQEKRKQWEIRENQKKKELIKERSKKQMIEEERERNAKKLKEFLEDYEDEKDDQKFYKGRELQKRIELREKEIEEDGRDRQKEKDELETIREKIYNSDFKDPELEFAKVLKAREEMYKPKLLIDVAEKQKDKIKRYEMEIEKEIEKQKNVEAEQERQRHIMDKTLTPSPQQPATPPSIEPQTPPPEFIPMTQPTTLMIKKRMDVKDVFNNDDEELPKSKKRKLVPLDYTDKKEEESKAVEEKKKNIRQLIERIPTDKDDLFSFHLDWNVVDNQLMEKRIRPWINKKIIEYIGEPEPTLVDFICSKVLAGSSPQAILDDVQMVLDEEAEVFVVKMWRLLVYEVEAKKLGLVKLEENGHKDP